MGKPLSKAARDNRANQLNRLHPAFYRSRGFTVQDAADAASTANSKPVLDSRSRQLYPDNTAIALLKQAKAPQ